MDGTDVSGLCHKSELSDNKSANAIRAFAVGDRVKAVVLKMDADKRRVAFGLKPSYFDDGDLDDVDEDDDEDDDVDEEVDEDDTEGPSSSTKRARLDEDWMALGGLTRQDYGDDADYGDDYNDAW